MLLFGPGNLESFFVSAARAIVWLRDRLGGQWGKKKKKKKKRKKVKKKKNAMFECESDNASLSVEVGLHSNAGI